MARRSENKRGLKPTGAGCIYQSIANDLCTRIERGEWSVGSKLPGRQALAQEYNVDLNTVQPAVARLLAVGLLNAIDRKGTFVARTVTAGDYFTPNAAEPADVVKTPAPQPLKASTVFRGNKPVVGVLMLGSYLPDDHSPLSGHWGNIVATAIERSLADVGGRAYFEYFNPHAGPIHSEDPNFLRQSINMQIVVDMVGMLKHLPDFVRHLETQSIPTVIVGSDALVTKLPMITYDQQFAGYLAAEHLIHGGYQEILVFRPFTAHWLDERLEGIRTAMERYHVPPEALTIYPDDTACDEKTYYITNTPNPAEPSEHKTDTTLTQALLAYVGAGVGRAIIAPNDQWALSIMKAFESQGDIAGREYGLIGFDDELRSRDLGLTTLRAPLDAMGSEAAHLAGALLRHEVINYQVSMRSSLIERASTHRTVR